MRLGSEIKASHQLSMMQKRIDLWINLIDTNADLLKTIDANEKSQLNYELNLIRDHLNTISMRIIA